MADVPDRSAGRRRAAEQRSRRPSPLTLLAVVIPLLTVAALALVRPATAPVTGHGPDQRPLARATVVCPGQLGADRVISLASGELASGRVTLRVAGDESDVELAEGLAQVSRTKPVIVTGEDALAPGLLATRSGGGAATVCGGPRPEQWFTGVGAGAEHRSTLSLTNPDRGPAVADVTVLGPDGVVDVPALRGVTVPGGATRSLDLDDVVPMREALALHVVVNRGRLAAHVLDSVDSLGRGRPAGDWMPPQAEPGARTYLAGLEPGRAERTLSLANPGDTEVRVKTLLVTDTSEFVPEGAEEIRVRPRSVVEVDVSHLLRGRTARGTSAVLLEATGPVTASMRTVTGDEVFVVGPGPVVEARTAVAMPGGAKQLIVTAATTPGVLTWRSWGADGVEIGSAERVEVNPGAAHVLRLPPRARLATFELDRSSAVLSVAVGPPGRAVLPLEELVTTSQVPHVRPALR